MEAFLSIDCLFFFFSRDVVGSLESIDRKAVNGMYRRWKWSRNT